MRPSPREGRRGTAPPLATLVFALGPVLALTLLGAATRSAAGQEAADLGAVVGAVSRAWQAGEISAVGERMPSGGILLHLPAALHPVLSRRLATAALSDLHGRAGRGPVAVRQSRLLGGEPPRAFAEMAWSPVPPGVSEALDYTVFVGLEERDGAWWVVEIRVLPPGDPGGPEREDR